MNYLDAAISYFPFEPSLWHLKVELYYRLMKEYFNNEEYDKAKDYLLKGLSVIDEAKNVNKWNMNPFVFNDNTIKLLQTMRYMLDNWNTDGIFDVNNIIHYSMFDLDINMDGIPDQWKMDDDLKSNITNNGELSIKTADWSYIYTQYPINLEKGKTYRIEVLVETPVSSISYYITGITQKSLSFINDKNKYFVEFTVEKEQNEEGNLIRIYVKDDCIVKNVLIKEITN
ncbi:hypothetical protein ODU73_000130 [Thermoclostridium stercorarium]|uniref:hypothetical protein n=1 Tax=Thermoclostridium stercorarium TaxID=1510 RepID=UPI0022496B59|nr:hypothetical protein [Thermoclostridium stercorarium]UZQ85764.1 hypothetical protein ODU73_000130 [Thermoclostridium stercorarium]